MSLAVLATQLTLSFHCDIHAHTTHFRMPARHTCTIMCTNALGLHTYTHTHTHTHTHARARAGAQHMRTLIRVSIQASLQWCIYMLKHNHTRVSRWSWRVSVWSVCFDWREACLPSCNWKTNGRVSQRLRFESRRGEWALFPSYRQLYLSSFSATLCPTQRWSLQIPDVAVRQTGVGVFLCMIVFHDGAGWWVSEVFVSTDARRACHRGVFGSLMGAYPRGTGSNQGMGTFFLIPSALSFAFLRHTYTHTISLQKVTLLRKGWVFVTWLLKHFPK